MADPAGPGKLMLVGVSGLDWKSFDARTRDGSLPRIAALRERGVCGRVTAQGPQSETADFATLLTGVHPEMHRVWMAQEPWEGGVRPLSRASWRTAPIWARLAAAGVGAGSVAWPGTRPGASWSGMHIDDSLLAAAAMAARPALRDRRVHPTDISADVLRGFVPTLERIDQSEDAMLPMLAVAIAEAATAQDLAIDEFLTSCGVKLSVKDALARYGRVEADAGEAVLTPPAQPEQIPPGLDSVRSECFGIFPLVFRGSSGRIWTKRGSMKRGMRSATRNSMSWRSSSWRPGLGTMQTLTSSSLISEGTGTAAHSKTASWRRTNCSTSTEEMCSPRLRMVSLMRSMK